ncbi:MAG: class I SAM-dependent methyltransferase [Dissulfurispiraceae bacterium]
MTDFNKSAWADNSFAQNYLDKADIYVMDRRQMFWFVTSLVSHFRHGVQDIKLLELGSGDGALTEELLKTNNDVSATLLDGGEGMIRQARERLKGYRNTTFIQATFQDLLGGKITLETYDFIVSSMAIHHLDMDEKASLFRLIASWLKPGGHFVDVDAILPPSEELEQWYFAIWKDWLTRMMDRYNIKDEVPDDPIKRYKDPSSMNKPDTLGNQLRALESAGFVDVDCYFKNGAFAVFGGKKQ